MKIEKLLQILIEKNLVEVSDRELVLFGLKQSIYLLINILIILFFGCIFGEFGKSICFLIAFSILRSYAGGYHCTTIIRCCLISIFIILFVILSFKSGIWNRVTALCTIMTSSIILFVIVPVDNKNHRLNTKERKIFRKKTLFILLLEIILSFFAILIKFAVTYEAIAANLLITMLLVVAGYFQNRLKK